MLALPFEQTQKLVSGLPRSAAADELDRDLQRFIHAPYTTVHLWFDRQITDLHHAALLDTTIQWIFHKSRIRSYPEEQGSYVELVIAASIAQLKMERSEILDSAMAELASFFPEVKRAKVVKSGILKEARATFSVLPGLDKVQAGREESVARYLLCGGLDGDGMAVDDGERREERLSCGRGGCRRLRILGEVPAAGCCRRAGS